MRIVDLKTFLSLPAETLFCKFRPCVWDDIQIKGESLPPLDFYSESLVDAMSGLDYAAPGESFKLEHHVECRDAMYEPSQLFMVFEKDDIKGLIDRLDDCLAKAYQAEVTR